MSVMDRLKVDEGEVGDELQDDKAAAIRRKRKGRRLGFVPAIGSSRLNGVSSERRMTPSFPRTMLFGATSNSARHHEF
jgi:hypothetical protein